MKKIKTNFTLVKKEMTANQYVDFCKKIIKTIRFFDSFFSEINILNLETNKTYMFKEDLSDFNFSNLYPIINEIDVNYINNSDETKLLENSKSWVGFSAVFFVGKPNIQDEPNAIITILQGASGNSKSSLTIEFPERYKNKINKNYIIRLMDALLQDNDIEFINNITDEVFIAVRQKGLKSIGWVNYTQDKSILPYLLENEIVKVCANGVIFSISDEIDFSYSSELVQRSKYISSLIG